MPSLQRAYEQLKEDYITIITIAMGDSPSEVILYRNKNPVEFLLLSDQDNSVSTHWLYPHFQPLI